MPKETVITPEAQVAIEKALQVKRALPRVDRDAPLDWDSLFACVSIAVMLVVCINPDQPLAVAAHPLAWIPAVIGGGFILYRTSRTRVLKLHRWFGDMREEFPSLVKFETRDGRIDSSIELVFPLSKMSIYMDFIKGEPASCVVDWIYRKRLVGRLRMWGEVLEDMILQGSEFSISRAQMDNLKWHMQHPDRINLERLEGSQEFHEEVRQRAKSLLDILATIESAGKGFNVHRIKTVNAAFSTLIMLGYAYVFGGRPILGLLLGTAVLVAGIGLAPVISFLSRDHRVSGIYTDIPSSLKSDYQESTLTGLRMFFHRCKVEMRSEGRPGAFNVQMKWLHHGVKYELSLDPHQAQKFASSGRLNSFRRILLWKAIRSTVTV